MGAIMAPVEQMLSLTDSLRERYEYAMRVQATVVLLVSSAAYLHLVVRRFAPGLRSLLAIVPIVILNIWLPMLFSSRTELVTRVVLGLLSFWLGNFKAIGLCLNRGPIAGNNWNLAQVCLLYIGPMYPRQDGPVKKGRLTDSAGPTSKLFSLAAAHAVALSLLAYMLAEVPLPMAVKHYVYALALCSFISFLMNGPAAVLTSLAELDVVPPFDRPWMSTSLADFWSRRWNNTVSLTLRSLIYDPIVEGSWIHKGEAMPAALPAAPKQAAAAAAPKQAAAAAAGVGSHGAAPAGSDSADSTGSDPACPSDSGSVGSSDDKVAVSNTDSSGSSVDATCAVKPPRVHPMKRLVGTAATFAVSGIMHEFILLYALHDGNTYPAGFWFMFFFSQMPLLMLEDVARRRLRKSGVRLARPLLVGWTTVVLMFTAYYFWYPPVEQYTDVALRVLESVNASAATAVQTAHKLLQSLGLQQAAVGGAAFVGSVSQTAL